MNLSDLFSGEDYRFQMRFQRGRSEDFFGPSSDSSEAIRERRLWLERDPEVYAALLPEGAPLLEAAWQWARSSGTLPVGFDSRDDGTTSAWSKCLTLGKNWEPDFLLLSAEEEGPFRLLGGSVCFPSSWSLAEKLGQPLEFIHGVVPGLNRELGRQIHGFLGKLRTDHTWLRTNWGLSGSPELNQHPLRRIPPLGSTPALEDVWLRIEHQALTGLPRPRSVLFGIRVTVHNLADLGSIGVSPHRLARALETMPEKLAAYKNLTHARPHLIRLLKAVSV